MAAGLGVLRALGVLGRLRSREALAAGGLAYLVGIAATLGICVVVLVAGGPFTLAEFAIVAAALASPLLIVRRADHGGGARGGLGTGPAGWAVIATLAALALLLLVGLLTVGNRPLVPGDADAWNQWTRKALLLFESPHLPATIFGFSGDIRAQPHYNINASYPLLLPLLEALHLRALGRGDPSSVHVPLWLLAVGFAWAGGFIASRVTRAVVWAPVLAGATALTLSRLLSGYADVPLAYYLGLGTLQLGVWLESERPADLGVAALLLAGAASVKNEGTAGAVLVLAVGLGLTVARRHVRAARHLVIALVLFVCVAVLPWRIWVAAHHLQTEEPLGRAVNPGFLVSHIARVGPSFRALGMQLGHPAGVTAFVAVAVAITVVCLAERDGRALAGFYLVSGLGYVVVLLWAYLISTLPLAFVLRTTTDRVVVVPAFIAAAAVMQLSGLEPNPPRGRDSPVRAQ